uniref:hypothetical protein n=1 Tax=Azospirillum argentinense TaxID=2970906 RepID=UPI0010C0A2A7|nr:hypothetical protein [Azospirillum argentinense]
MTTATAPIGAILDPGGAIRVLQNRPAGGQQIRHHLLQPSAPAGPGAFVLIGRLVEISAWQSNPGAISRTAVGSFGSGAGPAASDEAHFCDVTEKNATADADVALVELASLAGPLGSALVWI